MICVLYNIAVTYNDVVHDAVAYILIPFIALSMILDDSRLSSCSPKEHRAAFPATDMSVPESGRVVMLALPLRDDTWMLMVGSGSTAFL